MDHDEHRETTLLRTMVRPRWIIALIFALAIAAGFALLGQWQLQRAVESGTVVSRPTETIVPLRKAATPGKDIRTDVIGQLVRATGSFVPVDYQIIEGRLNHGTPGYWVVAHATLTQSGDDGRPVSLAVARGWAPTASAARAAIEALKKQPATEQTITGRLLPTDAPVAPPPDADPQTMTTMSTAALYNLWHGVDGAEVYIGYVVDHGTPPAGLEKIFSPPPSEEVVIDWLNVFYAAEWAIFAGFAVYLWYRVVRDAWEREREDAAAENVD